MRIRKPFAVVMMAAVVLSPAIAGAGSIFVLTSDEIGVAAHYAPTSLTKARATQDLAAWEVLPVSASGRKLIDGEEGWTFSADRGGVLDSATFSYLLREGHQHWRAAEGEAGWTGAFGI